MLFAIGILYVVGALGSALTNSCLLYTSASGTAYTAFRLFTDRSGGIVERFRSMPIARSAILWAHAVSYTHLDVYKRQCMHSSETTL